jgi:hypothetical protein
MDNPYRKIPRTTRARRLVIAVIVWLLLVALLGWSIDTAIEAWEWVR